MYASSKHRSQLQPSVSQLQLWVYTVQRAAQSRPQTLPQTAYDPHSLAIYLHGRASLGGVDYRLSSRRLRSAQKFERLEITPYESYQTAISVSYEVKLMTKVWTVMRQGISGIAYSPSCLHAFLFRVVLSAVYAIVPCPSVPLFVCPSHIAFVSKRLHVSPRHHGSRGSLVFWRQTTVWNAYGHPKQERQICYRYGR